MRTFSTQGPTYRARVLLSTSPWRRAIVIGPLRHTTGSLEDDEAALQAFFATITPRHPRLLMATPDA